MHFISSKVSFFSSFRFQFYAHKLQSKDNLVTIKKRQLIVALTENIDLFIILTKPIWLYLPAVNNNATKRFMQTISTLDTKSLMKLFHMGSWWCASKLKWELSIWLEGNKEQGQGSSIFWWGGQDAGDECVWWIIRWEMSRKTTRW